MGFEILKFVIYSGLIVIISKYILVTNLRKLAENLNLKPKTVGNVAGYATSMPELLTVSVSSFSGLFATSVFNIISSNVINLIQYVASIILNKNKEILKNKAIKIDLVLVILTIIIPITINGLNIELDLYIIPAFLILFALFNFINNVSHKEYLKNEDELIEKEIEVEEKEENKSKMKTVKHIIYLIITGTLLFFIGDRLGVVLENLCNIFGVPQLFIGIILGFITSIPELITFFESQRHHKNNQNSSLGVIEATNNLLTSNILNLFLIQTIGIVIYNLN